MTFGEYVRHVNRLLRSNPELEDVVIVTASDDEGNSFNKVYYHPCSGYYDPKNREFAADSHFKNFQEKMKEEYSERAVCLN